MHENIDKKKRRRKTRTKYGYSVWIPRVHINSLFYLYWRWWDLQVWNRAMKKLKFIHQSQKLCVKMHEKMAIGHSGEAATAAAASQLEWVKGCKNFMFLFLLFSFSIERLPFGWRARTHHVILYIFYLFSYTYCICWNAYSVGNLHTRGNAEKAEIRGTWRWNWANCISPIQRKNPHISFRNIYLYIWECVHTNTAAIVTIYTSFTVCWIYVYSNFVHLLCSNKVIFCVAWFFSSP